MRCNPIILLSLMFQFAIGSMLQAQHPAKTSKKKAEKNEELISIYLNKTAILKLSKSEYQQFRDSINKQTKDKLHKISDHKIEWLPANEPSKSTPAPDLTDSGSSEIKVPETKISGTSSPVTVYYSIYRDNILLMKLEKLKFRKFRDSIATKTKDTLFNNADNRVDIHTYRQKSMQKKVADNISGAVYINAKGYVAIHLPLAKNHHFRISFFDADDKHLFDIKTIKETDLVLDKTNFIHAGWFGYELYEDDVLKEKNRFFLQKE